MGYEVRLRRTAQKELDAVHEPLYRRIDRSISALEEDPRPPGVKKLAGVGLWRVRVGHYRVVYAIDDAARLVTIVRVARRTEDTYRAL